MDCHKLPEPTFAAIGGVVVHGDKRGRTLGFPTANVSTAPGTALPPHGVYCCLVRLGAGEPIHGASCSIGTNPTFGDVTETRVEVYIHDFDALLYGQHIDLVVVQKIRDMRPFTGLEALIAQTQRDVDYSRALLAQRAPLDRLWQVATGKIAT